MEQIILTQFELEAKEQAQIERDYRDWCRKYDPNYIFERDLIKTDKTDNQKN